MQDNEFGFDILTKKIKNISIDGNDEPGYTTDAQIMQSILNYSIDFGIGTYFGSRDLSKNHLLMKCEYYILYYKNSRINDKNRPENMNPKVVELLEKLTYLELVESEPYIAKNKEQTKKYRFTKLGRMVALLFLCNLIKKIDKSVYEKVYFQICDFYDNFDNSHSKFCLIFIKHCKINKEFTIVLQYLIGLLLDASSDKYEFLNKIKFLNTFLLI